MGQETVPGGFAFCLGITHRCGIFWLKFGWWIASRPLLAKWVGSCAIYVPKRTTWWFWNKMGGNQPVPIFHLGSPRKTDPTKCQVSFGKLRKKLFFGGLGGARFPGPSKVANCQSVEDCKKYTIFRDIGWLQLPPIRQNQAWDAHIDGAVAPSYVPTSINQPNQNMPHRSELSQDRRQNHQERHPSYPKTGGSCAIYVPRTTLMSILVVLQSCLGTTLMSILVVLHFCLGITLIDVAYFGQVGWRIAWVSRMSGSCAIYDPKRQLDVEKQNGGKPAQCQFSTWVRPRKRTPPSGKFPFGKLRKKLVSGGLGGVRFPGPSKVANCQSVEDCKKYIIFRDIDGATPTHSLKSGWECPHRWRNSLISPDIHQPT